MPKKTKRRSTMVCVSRKKAVELGLRKAPKAGAAPKASLASLYKTAEGKRLKVTLKELSKYKKIRAARQTCSDMSTLANQAVRAGNSFLSAHAGELTRASASSLRKRLKKIESSRGKFCKHVSKRIKRADASAKRAASMRGRR